MAGVGDLVKVMLTFVIFYCFEYSVCSHFAILVSISSNVVIYFTQMKFRGFEELRQLKMQLNFQTLFHSVNTE